MNKILKETREAQIKRYLSINFLKFIFGRFKLIRLLYRKCNIIKRKFVSKQIETSNNNYLSCDSDNQTILTNLKKEGFYKGLKLNNNVLNDLKNLSNKSELYSPRIKKKFTSFEEVDNFNQKNDNPCCLLNLTNPDLNRFVDEISRDKILLDIVGSYLGNINKIDTRISWSSVCEANDAWREADNQTVTFHYDVHDLNFVYVFFYLTDCDKNSGAHQLIRGSHLNKKFFKYLLGSVKREEQELEEYYNKNNFIFVEGSEGCGFIEDTFCYHRALKPINKPRLCLQFRYH